jgi:hypothetical protein
MPDLSPDVTLAGDIRIETYRGPRDDLRPLFELAEDSAAELDSYIDAGDRPEIGDVRQSRPPPGTGCDAVAPAGRSG